MRLTLLLILLFQCAYSTAGLRDVVREINKNFTYKADVDDNWQSCAKTKRLGTGDCEDYVFLVRCQLIKQGAIPEEIQVLGGQLNGSPHFVLRYKGKWVDTFGIKKRYPEFVIHSFWRSSKLNRILGGLSD